VGATPLYGAFSLTWQAELSTLNFQHSTWKTEAGGLTAKNAESAEKKREFFVFLVFFAVDSNEEVSATTIRVSEQHNLGHPFRGRLGKPILRLSRFQSALIPPSQASEGRQRLLAVEYRVAARRGWPSGLISLRNSTPHRAQFTPQIQQFVPYLFMF
jgi:hypothetical protein